MTNSTADITLANNYTPYGTVSHTAGSGDSIYAYTGEQLDSSGLTYLRARYYNPLDGRFLTIDPSRLESNLYVYAMANPVNYIDPSGYITEKEAPDAEKIVRELRIYNVFVEVDWGMQYIPSIRSINTISNCVWKVGEWELKELVELRRGVIDLSRAMGGLNKFIYNLGYIDVYKTQLKSKAAGGEYYMKVNNSKHNLDRWTVVHELGHSWDAKNGWSWSNGLVQFTMALNPNTKPVTCDPNSRLPGCNKAGYVYAGVPAAGSDINFDAREDFAESLAAYVYPNEAYKRVYGYSNDKTYKDFLYYADFRTTSRWAYIDSLIRLSIHLQQQR
ncbi:MAG: YD repeat-/RHS repeat-containing protein [Chloroflexi bacterium OLB14]|nr:MAG: YD repeat-/RHS repeat-containing protein [Chloroflexi bacterium OLB14]